MMLALEHIGELRERIGRGLPTVHPSLMAESGMLTHCGTVIPRFHKLCLFLMAKAESVLERVKRCGEAEATSFGSLSETTAHINDLNEILADDDKQSKHSVRRRKQLRKQAWALFDFFGPLTMTLAPRQLIRQCIHSVCELSICAGEIDAREDDILLAMQHVCSIICFVDFNTFQVYVNSGRSVDVKLRKGKECQQLMVALWEFLPEHFPHMHQHVKKTLERLENEKRNPSARI
ncbi:hypothetical protein BLNAU_22812 [Blattamonas nauphoetae]|uniref:Uncharacterized protein n=1 Tax=Blattamonas nauphoetae TaxID=2049346 RepID=A0ABQ9WS26_9EUKA|nr:hypothetical protein BLNAU_22812 [Blattamonas nauphoetae]